MVGGKGLRSNWEEAENSGARYRLYPGLVHKRRLARPWRSTALNVFLYPLYKFRVG